MTSARKKVSDYPTVRSFDKKAEELLKEAKSRGERFYGIKPWYCSARTIESGAKVAFIGANPGGGQQSEEDDKRLGVLDLPYQDPDYNAWLDDTHWEGTGVPQTRARETFVILFGSRGHRVLRSAACFNVLPMRTSGTGSISQPTWNRGASWAVDVLEHVAPEVIVCNGNGPSKSPWSLFSESHFGIKNLKEEKLFNNFSLKQGRIASGKLAGTLVIGLPHISRVAPNPWVRDAASKFGYPVQVASR